LKIDIVMWTKNGESTLPAVLKRLDEQLEKKGVTNQKIIVDDHSSDRTPLIAKQYGWTVVQNKGSGISDGANTALELVETERFASFEQDIILAENWLQKIPKNLEAPKIAAASGMRYPSTPIGLAKLIKYTDKRTLRSEVPPWIESKNSGAFYLGKTLDNTIYKTNTLKEMGGFPAVGNAGMDVVLAFNYRKQGYQWAVDYDTQSVHLRKNLKQELNHQYFYGKQVLKISQKIGMPTENFALVARLLKSPLTAFRAVAVTKTPTIMYIYPLMTYYFTKGIFDGRRTKQSIGIEMRTN
jgi:glycosyltransferase involved in cell wall biosynthesis